jgi:arsenate reductase
MAEGMMKKFYGTECYVQSVGVKSELDIDGFTIAVMQEIGVDLSRHRVRNFDQLSEMGDDLAAFDLVIALSPAAQAQARQLARFAHIDVEYWPITDPTGCGETREAKLSAYRQTRDQIRARMVARFGTPTRE